MYNAEIKTRFVQDYTKSVSTAKVCETVFNQFEPYEMIWNADLCTRSSDELQPIIDSIVGLRVRSKWMKLIILKDYVRWCMNVAHVPGACDGMLKINTTGLEKVRQQTVASPLHLQMYLNQICSPESEQSTDNIYRCFYWLAYGGVAEEDILCIKKSDVDFERMIIRYKGTIIPIYREAIPAFKNCVELEQFVYNHPNYTKKVWKARADGDTIVRGVRSNISLYALRVEISRRSKNNEDKTHMRLSYYRTWISGVFYRAYERELIGEKPDFNAIAAEQMIGKTYKLDSGRNTIDAKRRQIAKDYMDDYERWKLAFKV